VKDKILTWPNPEEHSARTSLSHPSPDAENDMARLQLTLAFLLISTMVYAQTAPVAPTPLSPAAAGTEGDGWLWLLAIPFIVVAVGVYFFIKKGRATTRH
jgi:hypothetical protein